MGLVIKIDFVSRDAAEEPARHSARGIPLEFLMLALLVCLLATAPTAA